MRYNILFLCSYYPNRLRNGGSFIERHALAVSEFADVSVLTLEPDNLDNNMPYELIYSLEHNEKLNVVRAYYNLKCVNIPVIRSIIRFYRFILAAYLGYKLLKTKTGKAQIVHLNVVRPLGIFALFLTYFEHLPLVLTEHSTAYLDENKGGMTYFETLLTRWVLKKAKYITPVSLLLKNAVYKIYGNAPHGLFYTEKNKLNADLVHFIV